MPIVEHPMNALKNYLPEDSFEKVVEMIHDYRVHLTVSRARKTVLGDYRHATQGKNHRITVNGNLNKYEFLITLLHELAHLLTFEQFSNKVEPHGKEWKTIYGKLLISYIELNIFPDDIKNALLATVLNPAATANGETALLKILRKYNDQKKDGYHTIEELPLNSLFQTENGRIFQKGNIRRKRFVCMEVATKRLYTFSPIAEVKVLQNDHV